MKYLILFFFPIFAFAQSPRLLCIVKDKATGKEIAKIEAASCNSRAVLNLKGKAADKARTELFIDRTIDNKEKLKAKIRADLKAGRLSNADLVEYILGPEAPVNLEKVAE